MLSRVHILCSSKVFLDDDSQASGCLSFMLARFSRFPLATCLCIRLANRRMPAAPRGLRLHRLHPEAKIEEKFLAVPDAKLAGQELKTLTAEPHMAATPEDHKTAEYVAAEVPRRRPRNRDRSLPRAAQLAQGRARSRPSTTTGKLLMRGPTREHVEGDPSRTIRAS